MSPQPQLNLHSRRDSVLVREVEECPFYEESGRPIPDRLRQAAFVIANLQLVALPAFSDEIFSQRAWKIIERIEAGVTQSNVVEVYRHLLAGMPHLSRLDLQSSSDRTMQRFRGMVEAQGYTFRRGHHGEIIAGRKENSHTHREQNESF